MYIEIVEEMLSFLFINVFCCFLVICGFVKFIYFDRGFNFIGVVEEMKMNIVKVEEGFV